MLMFCSQNIVMCGRKSSAVSLHVANYVWSEGNCLHRLWSDYINKESNPCGYDPGTLFLGYIYKQATQGT